MARARAVTRWLFGGLFVRAVSGILPSMSWITLKDYLNPGKVREVRARDVSLVGDFPGGSEVFLVSGVAFYVKENRQTVLRLLRAAEAEDGPSNPLASSTR